MMRDQKKQRKMTEKKYLSPPKKKALAG